MSGSADVGCSALLRRRRAAELDRHARALGRAVGQYLDADAVEFLDLAQFAALFVEQIEGRLLARAQDDLAALAARRFLLDQAQRRQARRRCGADEPGALAMRSEEHTSELQSLMRSSYAVFCLKQKKEETHTTH